MSIILRQRLKGKKISLYLDIYSEGKRQYEYLNLYLHPEPKSGKLSPIQRDENKRALLLADQIRAKRIIEFQSVKYGMDNKEKRKMSFIKYMEHLTEQRKFSSGNYGNWTSTIFHLRKMSDEILFEDISGEWLEAWKAYLKNATGRGNKKLAANTQWSYYVKVVAAIKQAQKQGYVLGNPLGEVTNLKQAETQRDYLTLEEVRLLVKTDCNNQLLKSAFLFSCLTGLRWSDIKALSWGNVEYSETTGYFIRFQQDKTDAFETLPISNDAYSLLGQRQENSRLVFDGLKYSSMVSETLEKWLIKAGIQKKITFHCARHTCATLLLSAGEGIYTVSKVLGHKSIKTTEIYGKIIDQKKVEAMNKIKLLI